MPFNAQQLQEHVFPYAGDDPETDIMLFFTDNKNEPRSINVRRCIETDETFTGNAFGYEGQDLEDFITACPRVPDTPIQFEFKTVTEGSVVFKSYFKDTNGLIFAYQNVYKNRYVSSLSPFSKVAYPNAIGNLGIRGKSEVVIENVAYLSVPRQGDEVASIRILFKEGDGGVWKLIDEIPTTIQFFKGFEYTPDDEDFLGRYEFKNDEVFPILPLEEGSKTFDKLPSKAQAQCFSGGRLMYGNYEEGFDGVDASAVSKVVYKDRLQDLIAFDLEIKPCFVEVGHAFTNPSFHKNSTTGFTIDTGGLPNTIPPSIYEIGLKVRAGRNMHIYHPSYRSSKLESNSPGLEGLAFTHEASSGPLNDDIGLSTMADESTGGLRLFADNIGAGTFRWKTPDVEDIWASVGSTPASPLILDVNFVEAKFIFQVMTEITKEDFVNALKVMLVGTTSTTTTIENYLSQTYNIEKIFIEGDDINETINRDGAIYKADIDLNLSNKQKFQQNTRLAELVNIVKADFTGDQWGATGDSFSEVITDKKKPNGFFIINKADVFIGFEPFDDFNTETRVGFRLKVCDVIPDNENGDGVMTCFPFPALGMGQQGTYAASSVQEEMTGNPIGYGPEGSIANHTPNPWDLSTETRISWPTVSYDFPDDTNLANQTIPFRIGHWIVLDKEGILNEDFLEIYRHTIAGAEGTTIASFANTGNFESNWNPNVFLGDQHVFGIESYNMAGVAGFPFVGAMQSLGVNSKFWGGYMEEFHFASAEGWAEATTSTGQGVVYEIILNETPLNEFNPNLDSYNRDKKNYLSIIDGNGGPGGQMSQERPFSDESIGSDGAEENITRATWLPGDARPTDENGEVDWSVPPIKSGTTASANRFGSVWSTTLAGIADNLPFVNTKGVYLDVAENENITSQDPKKKFAFRAPLMEAVSVQSNLGSLGDTELSFKTRATHDFGIVYYDKRGRTSKVNKLSRVYVPGYSSAERQGEPKGAVAINIDIKHVAPSWADRYKIFYSNRNETKRFLQYTSAGAFVEKGEGLLKEKIYVSLKYLQEHKASYAKSYGARTEDTNEPTLYRYSEGDTLRILSYYNSSGERIWAEEEHLFTVLGLETLSHEMEDHPLYNSGSNLANHDLSRLQRNGPMLVLKDNENSQGFSAEDVASGNHHWDNRVVFEIVSPATTVDEEIEPYFETSYGGKIIEDPDGNIDEATGEVVLVHEQPEGGHIIEEGDVFFRQVPINFREYSRVNDDLTIEYFPDILQVDNEGTDASQSNFYPYYLETNSITDLHRSSSKGYGKPNLINNDEFKRKMQASVIFSDKTTPDQFKVRHTSFPNNLILSYDMPEKFGDLNYMSGEEAYLTALQENKASIIPVDRAITSTAQGVDTLNISREVLNTPKFYIGEGGPAGNPESVVVIDGYIYFADKHNKRISRLDPGGQTIENISDFGMEEYFRRQFDRLLNSSMYLNNSDIRIPAGFDPMENEFIVSFLRPSDINSTVQEGQFTEAPLSSELANQELVGEEPFVNTIAFDHTGGKAWKARYSFNSTNYSSVNNNLISFKKSGSHFVWDHGKNNTRNKFHGTKYMSMVKPVSVAQERMGASATKLYNSLSLEGYYDWPAIIKTHNETATIPTFTNYEGNKYATIPKSRNSSSTSNVKAVGLLGSLTGVVEAGSVTPNQNLLGNDILVKFASPVTGRSILLGESVEVRFATNTLLPETFSNMLSYPIEIVDDYTIRYRTNSSLPITGGILDPTSIGTPITSVEGINIIHIANSSIYGDNLRDKYATVMLLNNSEEEAELYSVNLEVSPSKLDPSS